MPTVTPGLNPRYHTHNDPVEPRTMMTLQELIDHFKLNGIPRDAVLTFQTDKHDPKTSRNIVSVGTVTKHPGNLVYVTLIGHE